MLAQLMAFGNPAGIFSAIPELNFARWTRAPSMVNRH